MQVSIALSLLVAQVAGAPFNDTVCTFSHLPQLHQVKASSLVEKVHTNKTSAIWFLHCMCLREASSLCWTIHLSTPVMNSGSGGRGGFAGVGHEHKP